MRLSRWFDNFKDSVLLKNRSHRRRYAVFKIDHTAEAVQKAWFDIFPELSRQGYQFDEARQIIERYVVKMINHHHCEICVPIKSKD